MRLIPEYTFENFIVGPSNQFANAACLAVANNPGKTYNPLFIYGPSGVGKTHLLHAATNHLMNRGAIARDQIIYMTANVFKRSLLAAWRRDKLEVFRARFSKTELLLIDDIDDLQGDQVGQAELSHILGEFHHSHRQVVLAGEEFPLDNAHFCGDLREWIQCGLIADIHPLLSPQIIFLLLSGFPVAT